MIGTAFDTVAGATKQAYGSAVGSSDLVKEGKNQYNNP